MKASKSQSNKTSKARNLLASNWGLMLPILAIDHKHMMIMKSSSYLVNLTSKISQIGIVEFNP